MELLIHKLLVFVPAFILLNSLCSNISLVNSTCLTPDGIEDKCVPTVDCPPLVEVLQTVKRPLSKVAKKQLHTFICNTTEFKVCCPTEPIIIKEDDKSKHKIYIEKENYAGFTSHRNYELLPSECGHVDIGIPRITHGKDADLTEFPWMALLGFVNSDDSEEFRCGGTIINERYILTAAHCLEKKLRLKSVRLGEYDKSSELDCFGDYCNDPVQNLDIEEILPHPHFQSSTFENDIGLLRVTPILFNNKNVAPICLPREEEIIVVDENNVDISGWGLTMGFSQKTSNILQKSRIPIVGLAECKKVYENYKEITIDERIICAGGGENSSYACEGDSGGPIQIQEKINKIIRYVQQGVVSLGPKNCAMPSTFTKVKLFMPWILDNMKP